MDIFNLVWIAILIAFTAFFVVSEFAIVKVRSSRIDQLIEEGKRSASTAKKVISNLDEYLLACQLGITVTTLAIGWLGETTVARMLELVFRNVEILAGASYVLSIGIAFLLITFVHVVVGELAPKTLAVQKAEVVTLLTARPLTLFYKIMYPFIWVLKRSARILTRSVGLKTVSEHELAHSEEELRVILSESFKSGEINQSEFKYVNKIFEFDNRIAKEIMVPRTEIISMEQEDTLENFLNIVKEEKFTRYPIIDGDKDHVIGLVNLKEVMTDLISNPGVRNKTLADYCRPIIRVIDTIPIHDLLVKMQKDRIHMAILMDEYGGTSGLVTVEDILEEIVGEIRDEFDMDEVPMIQKMNDNQFIIDAKLLVTELNELLNIEIEEGEFDTVGGWMLTENFNVKQGDSLHFESYTFKILEMEEHHIKYIEVTKQEQQPTTLESNVNLKKSDGRDSFQIPNSEVLS
ncbi:hemolysin family protein [Mesobacillus maritimus]|uniref:HlyC/CorC family transporter n=1 Tax=Mesobacillus maritimus TaxID=1643336 RepID=A0ABS7JZ67_9BACI|nr:hemolysin family protein [Mesobacillus maritimus]MBY0095221.1 HlyC/CorC family transporter [Mesobacillus maritimus]